MHPADRSFPRFRLPPLVIRLFSSGGFGCSPTPAFSHPKASPTKNKMKVAGLSVAVKTALLDVRFASNYFRLTPNNGHPYTPARLANPTRKSLQHLRRKGLLTGHNGSRWLRAERARMAKNRHPLPTGGTNRCAILCISPAGGLFNYIGSAQ